MAKTQTRTSNVTLLETGYAAFGRGDIPAVLELLDPDIEWIEAEGFPYGGTYRGPEQVVENVFEKLGEEWEPFEVRPERFVDGGDTVVALGEYSGTYRETGKSVRVPFAHVWTIEDGRATRFQQFTDTALVQEALD